MTLSEMWLLNSTGVMAGALFGGIIGMVIGYAICMWRWENDCW